MHILLPLLFAPIAVSFFVSNWTELRIKLMCMKCDKIYVISELNAKTKMLIDDIVRNDNSKYMFLIIKENGVETKSLNTSRKLLIKNSGVDAVIAMSAAKRDISYFCLTENDQNNVNQCLYIINRYHEKPSEILMKEHENIKIYILSKDPDLDCEVIDAGNEASFRTHIINESQSWAYNLMKNVPLYSVLDSNDKRLEVTIIDLTKLGEEVLKAAIWNGQLLNISLRVNLIVQQGMREQAYGYLNARYPELFKSYDIEIYEADILTDDLQQILCSKCLDTNYIAVCIDDDDDSMRTAMRIRTCYLKYDHSYTRHPIIAFSIRDDDRSVTLCKLFERQNDERMCAFGDYKSIYSYNEIVNSSISQLARNIHIAYSLMYEYSDKSVEELLEYKISKEERERFLRDFYRKENIRKSNISAALNISYKLWQIGFEFTQEEGDNAEFKKALELDKVKSLRKIEHDRWMAFYRTEGWTSAEEEDLNNAIYKEKYSRAGRSDMLKMHPDICPFKDIARKSKLAGRKDMTDFDEMLIQIMPAILSDAWQPVESKKRKFYVKRRNTYESE